MIKETFHYLTLGYRTKKALRECQEILRKECNESFEPIEQYLESGDIGEATRYLIGFDHGVKLNLNQEQIVREKLLKVATAHKMRDQVLKLQELLNG